MHNTDGITRDKLRSKLLHPFDAMLTRIDSLLDEFDATSNLVEPMTIIQRSTLATKKQTEIAADTFAAGEYVKLRELNHDILAPSSTGITYCYFMLDGLAGNIQPIQRDHIMTLAYQTHHVRRQLMNLLDYARMRVLHSENTSSITLHTLLTPNIISMPNSDKIEWAVQDNLPDVMANRRYVGNVVVNLIANALGHTVDASVKLSVRQVKLTVVIEVRDTGNGISDDIQQHILKPFYQAKESKDQLGLGLTVASQQVKWMNSELKIESIEKDGTKAFFHLPTITKR